MKRFLTFMLAMSMCVSLAACGNDDANKPADDTTNTPGDNTTADNTQKPADVPPTEGEPDAEQYYNTFFSADPTTLDISRRSDTYSSNIMNNTMEGLIRLEGHTGEYVIAPAEAESWESNEAGDVWTFHLREGLKWEDGEPVTAEQYVYSLRRSVDPATGCPNSFFLNPIKNFEEVNTGALPVEEFGVKAIDERTLEITLSAPTPTFLQMINSTVYYPQREDKVNEYGEAFGSEADKYISNGPFKVESWTHNNSIVLVKNDNYWDADTVKLQKVTINIMADQTTYYNAFQNGEIDSVSTGELEWLDRFQQSDAVYVPVLSNTLSVMPFNNQDELFKNANVRKAFGLVIDREDLNDMCFSGLHVPTYGFVVPSISFGEEIYRDLAGDPIKDMIDALAAEGKTPKDLLIQGMEELGLGSDPSTLTVTLSLGGTSEWHKTLGEYLQQVYQNELGVTCNLEQMEWGIFSSKVDNGEYQMGFMGWGAYYSDPYDVLSLFESSYDAFGTGWSNAEFDALLKECAHEMDDAKRLEMCKQLETMIVNDDFVVNPLACSETQSFFKPYMRGYDTTAFGSSGYKYMYTSGR